MYGARRGRCDRAVTTVASDALFGPTRIEALRKLREEYGGRTSVCAARSPAATPGPTATSTCSSASTTAAASLDGSSASARRHLGCLGCWWTLQADGALDSRLQAPSLRGARPRRRTSAPGEGGDAAIVENQDLTPCDTDVLRGTVTEDLPSLLPLLERALGEEGEESRSSSGRKGRGRRSSGRSGSRCARRRRRYSGKSRPDPNRALSFLPLGAGCRARRSVRKEGAVAGEAVDRVAAHL